MHNYFVEPAAAEAADRCEFVVRQGLTAAAWSTPSGSVTSAVLPRNNTCCADPPLRPRSLSRSGQLQQTEYPDRSPAAQEFVNILQSAPRRRAQIRPDRIHRARVAQGRLRIRAQFGSMRCLCAAEVIRLKSC